MADNLPIGWIQTTLEEVCLPVATVQPTESPNAEFTYFDIGSIDNTTNRIVDQKVFAGREAPSRARQSVQKDDILFSTVRTYLRKIARVEQTYSNAVASTGFAVIRPAENVSGHFLFFQVLSERFLDPVNALQTGSSYPAVRAKDVFSQPLLLAPPSEQKRIVEKLSAALASVERAVAAIERASLRLERYRKAVLNAAVSGELTRQWRTVNKPLESGPERLNGLLAERRRRWEQSKLKEGKGKSGTKYPLPAEPEVVGLPNLPDSWIWASADQLVDARRPISYGVIKLGSEVKGGVPILRSSDVRPLHLEFNGLKRVARKIADNYERTYLKGGEVLITIRGTLGGVVTVPNECAGYNISREVAMLALLEPIASRAVAYFIGSHHLQQWLSRRTRGIAYTGINIETLRTLPIPFPPLGEQVQIANEVERRLASADRLAAKLLQQLARAHSTRQSLLREAFSGRFVPQDPTEESASILLQRIASQRNRTSKTVQRQKTKKNESPVMAEIQISPESLKAAWSRLGEKGNARQLFRELGLAPEQVVQFYEVLRATAELRSVFQKALPKSKGRQPTITEVTKKEKQSNGRFRLADVWLEEFKNLKDYTIRFDPSQGLDVVLGWNGTGKSNLFEALVIIFRDLHEWLERNRWPDKPMNGFRFSYEIDQHTVEVNWQPAQMKRPELKRAPIQEQDGDRKWESIKREQLSLPRFVFGYYSGPTNRLAEHFLPMKQAHYARLRGAKADDAKTLAKLLEQRRFFCAETHHAKYVLLAFSYKEDAKIAAFLKDRLRIVGFESALFVIRKPRWAKPKSKAEDFWGATGIMRRVMERLHRYAIAPMVLEQNVSYGYRSTTEDHYYFFLPDLQSLHSFAAEYEDARTFFLALESTDFSELIYDVKIQVRIESGSMGELPITFHQLSEGEQQLLMVLGLMRFTKSHQSLVLLDEPDTHLNPHWSVEYLKDLTQVMSDTTLESPEQQTSQIIMATHDPLVIASLVKEQIHLLKRDQSTGACRWEPASVNPRGLGFTGILTSEMFGFRSDLDPETLLDLDNRVRLVAREESLNQDERGELEKIDRRLAQAGFSKAFSDPYYAAFVRAWGRKYAEVMADQLFVSPEKQQQIDQIATEVLKEAIAEVEKGTQS